MQPYSLLSLGKNVQAQSPLSQNNNGTFDYLTQPYQINSSGTMPGTTVINVGQFMQINGNKDYILVSNPSSGIPEVVFGILPDGSGGMVVAKTGVSVLSLFS